MTSYNQMFNDKNTSAMVHLFAQSSSDMVKHCWWNNEKFDCSKSFANHAMDSMLCFTYNQDPSEIDAYGGNGKLKSSRHNKRDT